MDTIQEAHKILSEAKDSLHRLVEKGLKENRYSEVAEVARIADSLSQLVQARVTNIQTGATLSSQPKRAPAGARGAAEEKDRGALAAVERLDGEELLEVCRRDRVTMCGRAPAAVICEATRTLGAASGTVVDYRHSGWVTGDDSEVVAYAGVVIH